LIVRACRIGFLNVCLPLLLIILFSCGTYTSGAQAQPPDALEGKNVLLLYSGRFIAPLSLAVDEAIRATFQRSPAMKVELYAETLDVARFDPERYGPLLAAYLREKFANRKLDLIITSLPQAPRFLLKFRKELFPDTPIVFCLADEAELADLTPAPNVTGVPIKIPWKETLDLALGVHPDTRHVVVIAGTDGLARVYLRDTHRVFRPYENRLAFTYLTDRTLPQLLTEVAGLPPHTVIIYTTFVVDGAGQVYIDAEVSGTVAKAANAPVYSINNTYLGRGITGGHIIDNGAHATRATEIGLRILAGEKPEAITVGDVPSPPRFDARQLKRWNIAESRLPAGSVVLFKDPSFWKQYRLLILIVGVCLLEALLILALLVHRRRRRLAEAQLQENEERLRLATTAAALSVWSWDIPQDRVRLSDRAREMLPVPPPPEVTYAGFLSIVDPEDRARVDATLQEAIRTGNEFEAEFRIPQRDGTVAWIASRGSCTHRQAGTPVRMTGVSHVITDRKRAQEALKESEERFRTLFEESPLAISLSRDGRILYTNRRYPEMFGYRGIDELRGRPVYELWAPECREELAERGRRRDRGLPVSPEFEGVGLRKDGSRFPVHALTARVHLADGVANIGFLTDTTDRKRTERKLAEQLRIETFLAELSARFIHLPANQIESEIYGAQQHICEILDLDRSTLWQVPQDEPGTLRLTHIRTPSGTAPVPTRLNAGDLFPWAVQKFMRGETVTVSALTDLPPEAAEDRESLQRYDTKATVAIPLVVEGTVVGVLGFAVTRAEREWPEDVVQRFRMVAQVITNALARKRAEEFLESRLRFESLLSELSARFVNVRSDQIDSTIEDAQRRVCELLDLDLAALWQWSAAATDVLATTHVYVREGLEAPKELRQEQFPWFVKEMLAGRMVVIASLGELPAEAAVDRENCRLFGVKSNLTLPLSVGGEPPVGALGFNTLRAEHDWPDAAVKRLQLVAQVFTNALVRKRSEEALRESEARLTLAAASADARLWEIEADTGRMWMTEEGRGFFGFAPDKVLTLDDLAGFIHPDDRESWRQNIRQALETAQPMRSEFRVVGADGNVRWISSQGRFHGGAAERPRRLLGVSIDVTERKRAEERLRTSEALSTGVLASLPGYMVIVDRSGIMLRTSDTWKEFAAGDGALDPTVLAVGAGQHQASQRAGAEIGPVAQEVLEGIEAVLTGTRAEFRLDYAYPTRTEERWASTTVLPLQRPEGGAVIYHQDITSQERSRLEAERLRRDLTHAGRVTTMGEMAAALAHELNQPLTAILSNAHAGERYLTRAEPPLDEIREILQDVVGDARRAGEVIQRLRSLLRKEETRFLPLDVNQVTREVAALLRTDAVLRDLVIDLDLAPDLPSVRGDRVQIQQVLLNLLLNGMEAIGSHGEGRRVVIRTLQADGAVCVSVRDQGPGIPGDMLSRIFETFYTTKPDGMGMGLAISRSIVEAHGGRIWAENNPDRGATFSLTLPACPPEPTTA
jgi:PAS domain S-box-containing protein